MQDYSFQAMGTECSIIVADDRGAVVEDAVQAAIDEVDRLEAKYSRYRDDGFLGHLNDVCGAGGRVELDAETSFLLSYAEQAWKISEGAFDVTSGILRRVWRDGADEARIETDLARLMPKVGFDKLVLGAGTLAFSVPDMEIDLGGLVKEYAADRAAAICRKRGVAGGLINLGGDIAAIGPCPDASAWAIDLTDPTGTATSTVRLDLVSGGLATSGDYERYVVVGGKRRGHILDARTGRPAEGLRSVTVLADTALLAGLLATLAILRGRSGLDWLASRGVAHVAFDADGRLVDRRDVSAS